MTQTCNKSHQCYLDVSTLCVTVLECLPGASSIRVSLSKTRYRFSTKDIHQNLLHHTLPIFGFHVHHQEAQDSTPGHEGSLGLHFLTAMSWISSLNVPEAPPRQCNQPLKHLPPGLGPCHQKAPFINYSGQKQEFLPFLTPTPIHPSTKALFSAFMSPLPSTTTTGFPPDREPSASLPHSNLTFTLAARKTQLWAGKSSLGTAGNPKAKKEKIKGYD